MLGRRGPFLSEISSPDGDGWRSNEEGVGDDMNLTDEPSL